MYHCHCMADFAVMIAIPIHTTTLRTRVEQDKLGKLKFEISGMPASPAQGDKVTAP